MFKDIWNLPAGESFVSQFLLDANVNYLWKDSKGKGSLQLSFESVLDKAQHADYWIAPGYFSSKAQLLENNPHYKNFTAFKNNNIYIRKQMKYNKLPTKDKFIKDLYKIIIAKKFI